MNKTELVAAMAEKAQLSKKDAEAALKAGHSVTLVSGPVNLPAPENVRLFNVVTAAEMADVIHSQSADADVIIMAAAVADYRPVNPLNSKMKKLPGDLYLQLERTEDILATLGKNKRPSQLLIGFAAETDDLEENALGKLQRKNLDWIAANSVADGFGTDTNSLTLFSRNGDKIKIPANSKKLVAEMLLKTVLP